ncbi:putative polygalacturonase [Rosa chinensis]|uniref:Putative polygalacturonase n=1 Tax=Rosa chinensis TaxID=74649 RepID=A0A2P6RK72_ROSCH|nr:putative polygalacturonase [Rosa chinensis]
MELTSISIPTYINIQHSFIGTGDDCIDCIAINIGSFHMNITDVLCGPGHGISVGSPSEHASCSIVKDVQVTKCTFKETQNGARIKTYGKAGQGMLGTSFLRIS